ncbi:MAG: hypothetical protein HY075_15275, partial [Deltaproteobacteria bacterium]|nr:hypothetical protein [Deltaproteobacteria bacterium]
MQPPQAPQRSRLGIFYLLVLVWLVVLGRDLLEYNRGVDELAYSDFLSAVLDGRVAEATLSSSRIEGRFKPTAGAKGPSGKSPPKYFSTVRVED